MSSIVGRIASASRALVPVVARASARQIVPKRNGGDVTWVYRKQPVCTDTKTLVKAEVLMALAWYWVMWHFYYDFGHVAGEHPYPDPSKWTDEELGIPAVDED